jgi:hypothetical protein
VILGVTTGTVLLVVIVIAVAINVYKHVQAKKLHDSSQSPPNRRFSDARVHPLVFNGQQYNDNNTNTFNTDCPPVYSEFAPRPMSPPPRYTMFDTNTFRWQLSLRATRRNMFYVFIHLANVCMHVYLTMIFEILH